MPLFNQYPRRILSFLFLPSLYGFLFLKECVSQSIKFIYDILSSLVNKFISLASGSYSKYAGFFLEWYLYAKKAIIANPAYFIATSIGTYYTFSYIY